MKNWVIILTFNLPHEAHMAKAKLESEEIKVIIQDELVAQVNNHLSSAVGGVKLLIHENDMERAILILKETGYIKEAKRNQSKLFLKLDKFTSKFPVIGKTVFEFRLTVLTAFLILIVAFTIIFFTLPS